MSVKPSRSEIETAVAGRAEPVKPGKARRPNPLEFQADRTTARRQQVIGGDLGGISKRRKRRKGRFGGLRTVNYVNWFAAAIVLMIVIAFFWPHPANKTVQEVAGKSEPVDSAPFYNESRVDEEQNSTIDQSFVRETDLDRAAVFREQEARENQLRTLIAKAESHVEKGEYSLPKSGNALLTYRQILKIDPNNASARQGLEYIRGRFLAAGLEALAENNAQSAESSLEKLKAIDRRSDEYSELSAAVANWQVAREIDELLLKAERALDEQSLILPARQNALFYYQEILKIDQGNQAALDGVQAIAGEYITKANAAIFDGEYQAATGYLATVSVIDPKNASIPIIREMLTKAERLAADSTIRADGDSPAAPATAPKQQTAVKPGDNPAPASSRNLFSNAATPGKEAREQEAFDQQYLQRGLDAYYLGEYESAVALLKPLADKGVARAQFRIAYMYFLGRGLEKNRQEADRIIRAALPAIQSFAAEGRVWAQSDLGSLYEDGLVLPRDYAEAVYWYRTAAEQGYPGAQTNLGIMYARGLGVSTSRRTAIEWFQRAAKQGDVSAKRNLEAMGITP